MKTSSEYNEDYFERGEELGISLYTDYRWLPELTIPFCAELIAQLGIGYQDTILDFGCAKGYMVYAFRLLHRKAWGVDVSRYAVENAHREVKRYIKYATSPCDITDFCRSFDWIIAKDVFEHIEKDALEWWLRPLHVVGGKLFAIIPLGDGQRFIIPDMGQDVTHRICESATWWTDRFEEAGFRVVKFTLSMPRIVDRYSHVPGGKGYFVCHGE